MRRFYFVFKLLVTMFLLLAGCRPSDLEGISASPLLATAIPDTAVQMSPTSTQEVILQTAISVAQPSVAFDPAYTENTPLKDTQQILAILESLHQMEAQRLTKPGWYLKHELLDRNILDEYDRSYLVHVVDQNGNCLEQMVFFRRDGSVIPFLFISASGNKGGVDPYTRKVFSVDDQITSLGVCNQRDIENPWKTSDYYLLSNNLSEYRRTLELMAQQPQSSVSEFNAWFIREGNQELFVVRQNSTGPTGGSYWDDESSQFQSVTSASHWDVYDLSSGRPLRTGEELTLGNGKVTRWETQHTLFYFSELPTDLQTAFDQVVAGLEALSK